MIARFIQKSGTMKYLLLLSIVLSVSGICQAQIINTSTLDNNNASALISDEGIFFNNQNLSVAGYEIPSGSGKTSIFAMSHWIGALDINGMLHLSANSYGSNSFHSGPIADQNNYGTLPYTNQYTECIWNVSDAEIQNHIANYSTLGYVTPSGILNWPGNGDVSLGVASQLAPYIDVNNDWIYDPSDGDYPDIKGDQAVYVIMNDESFNPDGNQLGIELHIMFYQFSSGNYLNNTTFMQCRAYNRSTTSYYDYRQALYIDFDLGNYADDYIGCDTINNIAYVYNGDDIDESSGGNIGYGIDPPCQAVVSLSHEMSSFGYYTGSGTYPYTDPATDIQYWRHMNSQFSDGTQWVVGGTGYPGSFGSTSSPTNYLYPGNPNDPNSWSEQNTNALGNANAPGDRRVTMTISEDEFPSGTYICSEYAFIYDKSFDRLTNVQNVINIAGALRTWYDAQDGAFACQSSPFNSLTEAIPSVEFTINPNPSTGSITVSLPSTEDEVTIEIHDLSGRVVYKDVFHNTNEIQIKLSESSGVYLIKTKINSNSSMKRLILQ